MSKRLIRVMALVLLGALLATFSGLAGCAKEEGKVPEIVIGFQTDLTGPAAFAVGHLYDGFQDYFRMVEEEDPIPGVKIKIITWDTRSDAARVKPGYVWMKGQGVDLLGLLSGVDRKIVADDIEEDQIPVVGTQAVRALLGHEWMFNL